ncbi:DUF2778 domain-containing protein [Paraburkholderia sp. MM5384-R2]|uniref:DUF2778 domain-containing protein n=1 Tax=Paraburkholderia sp. MM5384-R2 TaxID=2723097 RepID=UPI0016082B29|nr:DUF2778 domain-containing protein [Paraburkholderia sp. MM5384-R2]MBB5499556.1 hypothetical protein [Paraburkholderia sp. MM5384-R2]
MALQGKFVVDNAPTLLLVMFGVGTFPAFSGDDIYRNRGGCTAIVGKGPLPAGKYWIVARPSGGIRSRLEAMIRDTWNTASGNPSHHDEWFALYRDDGLIDDWTWVSGVKRGNFRLHPVDGSGVSFGCITLKNGADFNKLRQVLLHTPTIPAGNSGMRAYGWIEVTTIGDICP